MAPAEPRPDQPRQLAGLPQEQQRREGRGRCVRRVVGRCAEDAGEGARRLAREGEGAADAAEPGTAPPSLAPPRGSRRRAEDPILGTEPEREWGKEQKICAEGPSLSGAAREMSIGAALQGAGGAWV